MSLPFTAHRAHQPFYLTLTPPGQDPYPTLTKTARYLLDWLQARAVRYPNPMWFGSAVHLAMMANMPFQRCGWAFTELIDVGLLAIEREAPEAPPPQAPPPQAPRVVRPAELQAAEPFALWRLEPIGSMPVLYGPAREVWQWLEWLVGEGQGPTLLFPSLAHCASASGLSPERLYLGLRQLYDNGLVRFEQPPGAEREGGAA